MFQRSQPRRAPRTAIFIAGWSLLGGCATYENTLPDESGVTGGAGTNVGGTSSEAGEAGSSVGATAGSSASAGTAGVAHNLGGGGGASGAATGGMSGGQTGGGGGGISDAGAGRGGVGGAGGAAGASGSGGKSTGGGGSGGSGGSAGSGGSGGSGGSTSVQTCAKNPIPARSAWVVTASKSGNGAPPSNAHDGDVATRWTTGADQAGGEWLQIDFGTAVTMTKLTLMLGSSADDYPRNYATRFSNSSGNMAAPVLVSGVGAKGVDTVLNFPAGTTARYLLISQSGKVTGLWWSVAEIQAACAD
ncbi:MAG TPA: discoidin domain-containing protein [Polyangiaceae bacterium]|nr:discoidin domain-containing protein [Polyangiaceae bacterium]